MEIAIPAPVLTHTVTTALHIYLEKMRGRERRGELTRRKKERSEEWEKAEKKDVKGKKKEGERRDLGTKRREERAAAVSVSSAESISGPWKEAGLQESKRVLQGYG